MSLTESTCIRPRAGCSGSHHADHPCQPQRDPVAGRECGTCTLCCKTVAVKELAKPNGVWCRHSLRSNGCAIYHSRPSSCSEFNCEWLLDKALGREWKPDRAKFVLFVTQTNHLTACVDPGFPSAWRQPPYYESIKRWAVQFATDPLSAWPGVDVWIGQRCIVVLPDRDVDLGVVAPEEAIRIDSTLTAAGKMYDARKFVPGPPLVPGPPSLAASLSPCIEPAMAAQRETIIHNVLDELIA